MAKKEAFGKFKEFCDMCKSNSPLICGEKLIQLFLWQIFTECLLSAGPCAEGWGYRDSLNVTQGLAGDRHEKGWIMKLCGIHKHCGSTQGCQLSCTSLRRKCLCSIWKIEEIYLYTVEPWVLRSLPHHHIGWAPLGQPLCQDWRCWDEREAIPAFH